MSAVPAQAAPAAPRIALKTVENNGSKSFSVTYADLAPGYKLHIMDQAEMNKFYKENKCTSVQQFFDYYYDGWYDDDDDWYYDVDEVQVGFAHGSSSLTDTETDLSRLSYGTRKVVAYLEDATGAISPASNVLTVKNTLDKPDVSTIVKSTSITLKMDGSDLTGYQIYRKIGKKYQKLATVATNTYKDSGLTSSTDYTYKVRAYYKDPDNGKTTYSPYKVFKRTTKGGALKLKVQVTSTKNVKLSWTKVSKAKSYEIYRSMGYSEASATSKGLNDGYSARKLIGTVSSKKKASFTDKKTLAGENYTYTVRAVMNTGKAKSGDEVRSESRFVDLNFGTPDDTQSYTSAYGSRTIVWNKVYGASGYIVEKKQANGAWKQVKKLGSTTTKYTFKPDNPRLVGTNSYENETEYRLCAYKDGGKTISGYKDVTVKKTLGLVQGISAKKSGNGVKVSWKAVSGASYYEVYRVKANTFVKNSDIGGYVPYDGTRVTEYVGAVAPVADTTYSDGKKHYLQNYRYSRPQITGTSVIDYYGDIYDYNGDTEPVISGRPVKGVSYQYYVVAYKDVQTGTSTKTCYAANSNQTTPISYTVPEWRDEPYMTSVGCKNLASASYTAVKATSKPAIKSVKAGKKSATIKLKKKVKNASEYRIYRAKAKKNGKAGKYVFVATSSKTTYKDTGLQKGQKYFYKVKAVRKNEAGADKLSAFSSAKSVRAK